MPEKVRDKAYYKMGSKGIWWAEFGDFEGWLIGHHSDRGGNFGQAKIEIQRTCPPPNIATWTYIENGNWHVAFNSLKIESNCNF